jgi:CO dehydrogenase nickel-insertion accessory protein CooC1
MQQIHGRIKNPTLKRILVIDDDDDINLVSKVGYEGLSAPLRGMSGS